MFSRKIALAIVALALLSGCGSGMEREAAKSSAEEAKPLMMPPQAGAPAEGLPPAPAAPAARMVIRTATVSLVVENAAEYLNRAVAIIEREGGYVAGTRQWQEGGQVRATATFRIPADKLTPVLAEIRKGAVRVASETITGQDVSEEFADLGAQLTNLRATEVELRQLLATVRERTQKASEVLEVHSQLSTVRREIDRLQGRMDFIKQMTAMSTIQLELIPDQLSEPIIEPGWRPAAIAKTAARTLMASLKGLGSVLIWIVVLIIPLCVVFGIFTFIGLRVWRLIRSWR